MTLRNWKHEEFARLVAGGTDAKSAYGLAGFAAPDRRNHNRLLRDRGVAARIEELRRAREDAARAASVPINQVLANLDRRGICRVADFFERDAAGIFRIRNLQDVPVEVSIAFLRLARESFGLKIELI